MKRFSVWVGGSEVNSYELDESQAERLAEEWLAMGYEDVTIEELANA